MDYNIYRIKYQTVSVACLWAVVSANSQEKATSLLKNRVIKEDSLEGKSLGFKIVEIKYSGFKSDKKGILHYHNFK